MYWDVEHGDQAFSSARCQERKTVVAAKAAVSGFTLFDRTHFKNQAFSEVGEGASPILARR